MLGEPIFVCNVIGSAFSKQTMSCSCPSGFSVVGNSCRANSNNQPVAPDVTTPLPPPLPPVKPSVPTSPTAPDVTTPLPPSKPPVPPTPPVSPVPPTPPPQPKASCTTTDGKTFEDSFTLGTAFTTDIAPFGTNCFFDFLQSNVKCSNGQWVGAKSTKVFVSCKGADPLPCNFNGQTVAHMGTVQAFTVNSVPFNNVCSNFAQTLTCSNGQMIGGSATFSTCTVQPAPPTTTTTTTTTTSGFETHTLNQGPSCDSVCGVHAGVKFVNNQAVTNAFCPGQKFSCTC